MKLCIVMDNYSMVVDLPKGVDRDVIEDAISSDLQNNKPFFEFISNGGLHFVNKDKIVRCYIEESTDDEQKNSD